VAQLVALQTAALTGLVVRFRGGGGLRCAPSGSASNRGPGWPRSSGSPLPTGSSARIRERVPKW